MRGRLVLKLLVGGTGFVLGCAMAVWLVLWVGVRSSTVRVPQLVGLEPSRAAARLQESGLLARVQEGAFSAEVPPGKVAIQRPGPGFQLKRGSTVLLQPSLGEAAVRMSDLTGMPVSLAEAQLEGEGLLVERRCEVSGEADAVVVLATSPGPGTMVAPGSAVVLLVNRAPRRTTYVMPDFVGMPEGEAARAVAALGFRVAAVQRVDYPGALPGTVLRQDPAAGGPASEAAVVGLWVSR
jgi:eukaryotic-like serine/threonine-protein kinase